MSTRTSPLLCGVGRRRGEALRVFLGLRGGAEITVRAYAARGFTAAVPGIFRYRRRAETRDRELCRHRARGECSGLPNCCSSRISKRNSMRRRRRACGPASSCGRRMARSPARGTKPPWISAKWRRNSTFPMDRVLRTEVAGQPLHCTLRGAAPSPGFAPVPSSVPSSGAWLPRWPCRRCIYCRSCCSAFRPSSR